MKSRERSDSPCSACLSFDHPPSSEKRWTAGSQCLSDDERAYMAFARVGADADDEAIRLMRIGRGSWVRNCTAE